MNLTLRDFKVIAPLFFIILLVYLATLNQCLTLVIDSACYIADIAKGELVFSPHHLVYHIFFYWWNDILVFFGFSNIIVNIASFNAVFGALSVVLIYLILKNRFGIKPMLSALYLILPAFSFGFWIVSVSVNVYTVPLFCLLCCFYLFLAPKETKSKWMLLGVFHSIAILFNQWNIFIFPVIFISILFLENRKEIFRKYFLYYFLVLTIITGFVYIFVMVVYEGVGSPGEALLWLTKYGREFSWTTSVKKIALEASVGISQAFTSPYWFFGSPVFMELARNSIPSHASLREEAFFASGTGSFESVILLIITVILVLIILYSLFVTIGNFRETRKSTGNKLLYLVFWIVFPSIMPLFWSGSNQRYWFIQVTAFYLLAIVVLHRRDETRKKKTGKLSIIGAGIAVFTVNLFGTILPGTDINKDLNYCKAGEILAKTNPGDLVIFKEIWNLGFYFDIFGNNVDGLILQSLDDTRKYMKAYNCLAGLDSRLKTNKVFVLEEVFMETSALPPVIGQMIDSLKNKDSIRFIFIDGKFVDYYIFGR